MKVVYLSAVVSMCIKRFSSPQSLLLRELLPTIPKRDSPPLTIPFSNSTCIPVIIITWSPEAACLLGFPAFRVIKNYNVVSSMSFKNPVISRLYHSSL